MFEKKCFFYQSFYIMKLLYFMQNNEDNKLWLELNNSPWSDVQVKWKSTFKLRRKEILDKSNSTAVILKNWPLYRHSDGFNLVSKKKFFVKQ